MANDDLVVSMFTSLERRLGELGDKVDDLTELATDGGRTQKEQLVEARKTNGRLAALEAWRLMHEQMDHDAAVFAAGRKAQRSDDIAKVAGVRDFIQDYWISTGLGALIAGGMLILIHELFL